MAVGEVVTLVNRTSRPLTVIFNGKPRILTPGPNAITAEWVRYAKMQNPRMGSFLPGTLEGEYLVGVEGVDPVDMIDESEKKGVVEMFDRGTGEGVTNVATGERDPRRMNMGEFSAPVPTESIFSGRN